MSKRIIVTGAAGFLGHHLVRALTEEGHQVKLIDLVPNPDFETVIADVRDLDRMKIEIKDADAVFHLASLIQAGESVKEPQKYVDYNIDGSLNILEAMRINGIKSFLFSSSAAIYGEPEQIPILEDDRTLPINPYGVTKLTMEGFLRSYVESHGFTGIALRYFNLYGPEEHHEPETHAIPRFIDQIINDQEVTVWGQGEHQRDFIYIDDVVSAHLGALQLAEREPNKYHYFNLSTERPTTVMEVVQLVAKALGKEPKIKFHPPRPGDPLVLTASAAKAHQQFGWQAQVDLEEGIKRTVEYFLKHT